MVVERETCLGRRAVEGSALANCEARAMMIDKREVAEG
jgi:hypothetical protein